MGFFSRSPSRVDTQGMTKGQAKELEQLLAAVDENPQDLRARRGLADLYKAAGRTKQAIAEYQALAGAYAAQGLLFRAIAVCKQILTLDAAHDETHQMLATLYAKHDAQSDRALAETSSQEVEITGPMSVALLREAVKIPDAPMSDDGDAIDIDAVNADAVDDGVVEEDVTVDFDLEPDIVDADTLAALTIKPEGSVSLPRPAAVPLFSGLSREAFSVLVKELRCWQADAGAIIVSEGEAGDSLFVVAHGKVRVEVQGKDGPVVVGEVGEEGFFGEVAIIASRPRTATVIADVASELLEISRKNLEELYVLDPQVNEVLQLFAGERLRRSVLMTSPLFAGLDPALTERVAVAFEPRDVAAGAGLIEQGAPSEGLYVVLNGAVDVVAKAEIGSVRLKQLGPGDVFGEMSLLSGAAATASVVAHSATQLLVLSREVFASFASEPAIRARIEALSQSRAAFNARFLPSSDVARAGAV